MPENFNADTIVQEVLDRHPEAVKIFIDLGLMCVGCPVAAFHTLTDVAREHRRNLKDLLRTLNWPKEDAEQALAAAGEGKRRRAGKMGSGPRRQ